MFGKAAGQFQLVLTRWALATEERSDLDRARSGFVGADSRAPWAPHGEERVQKAEDGAAGAHGTANISGGKRSGHHSRGGRQVCQFC